MGSAISGRDDMQVLDAASQSMPLMSLRQRFLWQHHRSLSHNTKTSKDEVSMSARSLWQHSCEICSEKDSPMQDSDEFTDIPRPVGTND